MSVDTLTTYNGPLDANGSTTAFPFTFKAMGEDEITVVGYDGSGATVALPAYSASLSDPGGTVTFESAPANGCKIWISSNPDFRQDIAFEDGSRWLAEPVNEANDRAAVRALFLRDVSQRSLVAGLGQTPPPLGDLSAMAEGDALGKVGDKIGVIPGAGAAISAGVATLGAATSAGEAAIGAAVTLGEAQIDAHVADAEAAVGAAAAAAMLYNTLAEALAGAADGDFANVLQANGHCYDTYQRAGGDLLLKVAGTPVGKGVLATQRIALQDSPAVPAMPHPPLISIYGIDANFNDGVLVPNRMAAAPTRQFYQMLNQIRDDFGNSTIIYGQPDPWGGNTAVRLQLPTTGSVIEVFRLAATGQSGDYRVQFQAKSSSGAGSQSFILHKGFGTPEFTTAITEGAWAAVNATFTGLVGNDSVNVRTDSGSLDVIISPPQVGPTQVKLPSQPIEAIGALVSNQLGLSGSIVTDSFGNIVMPHIGRMKFAADGVATRSFDAMTMIMVVKQTASNSGFCAPFFHKAASGPDLALGGQNDQISLVMPGLARAQLNTTQTPLGREFCVLALRFNHTQSVASWGSVDISDNSNTPYGTGTGGSSYPVDWAYFGGGGYNDTAPFNGLLNQFHIFDSYLSDADLSAAVRHVEGACQVFGNSVGTRNMLICDGDSITSGVGASAQSNCYAEKTALANNLFYFNDAFPGSALASLYDNPRFANTTNKIKQGVRDGKNVIYTLMIGVNAAPAKVDVQAYVDTINGLSSYGDGTVKFVLCTATSSSGQSNADKDALNAMLRTITGVHLADVAADPNLGGHDAYLNATYFPDQLHPSQVGHDAIMAIVSPVVASVMV